MDDFLKVIHHVFLGQYYCRYWFSLVQVDLPQWWLIISMPRTYVFFTIFGLGKSQGHEEQEYRSDLKLFSYCNNFHQIASQSNKIHHICGGV
jgi:hypothetical protein